MENIITICNFGPVKEAEIDLNKNFQIYIGAQASGKSTICKVVFFCQKVRDYTLEFLSDSKQFTENNPNEYFTNYLKCLRSKFMSSFGTTKHMQPFTIDYKFNGKKISIRLSRGYVKFQFSSQLRYEIEFLIKEAAGIYVGEIKNPQTVLDYVSLVGLMKKHFEEKLAEAFSNDKEIMYIPAGRSLLATMSDQLMDFPFDKMDLTMREFIILIRNTKSKFGTKIPEMIQNYTKMVKGQINDGAVKKAYEIINKILKADYSNETDGEKLYFNQEQWVKLMYSSSGQQEALWILMLIFIVILEKRKSFIIIEEPEAHLFPIAQRDIVELISLMVNTTESKVVVTTHSPYILTSANLLLYADKVEKDINVSDEKVIMKNLRISYTGFAAYKVNTGTKYLDSLLDEETHMIDTTYIDEVSNITYMQLEKLLFLEASNEL